MSTQFTYYIFRVLKKNQNNYENSRNKNTRFKKLMPRRCKANANYNNLHKTPAEDSSHRHNKIYNNLLTANKDKNRII